MHSMFFLIGEQKLIFNFNPGENTRAMSGPCQATDSHGEMLRVGSSRFRTMGVRLRAH